MIDTIPLKLHFEQVPQRCELCSTKSQLNNIARSYVPSSLRTKLKHQLYRYPLTIYHNYIYICIHIDYIDSSDFQLSLPHIWDFPCPLSPHASTASGFAGPWPARIVELCNGGVSSLGFSQEVPSPTTGE